MKLFEIFNGASRKNVSSEPFQFYFREDKPVALQGWIFNDSIVSQIGESLAATGLSWMWESTRTGPPSQRTDDQSPEHRSRTELTPDCTQVLQADLLEKNLHGFRRFVALYGGGSDLLSLTDDDDLRREVEAFASGNPSIISLLVVQFGDVAADVIYFNSDDASIAPNMLTRLGIPALSGMVRLKYKEMNGEDLETTMTYLSCAEHDH